MWIKIEALLCCIIATSLAANEPRSKKKDDPRGKRNLEYNIAHHFSVPNNYRAERRISTLPQIPQLPQYPLFFPVQQPYVPYRKGRPNIPAPPYAVQMEPLVHYSQRDPLYESNGLTFIGDGTNDLRGKEELLLKEHSHASRSVYGAPHKQIVERPVYIKEPEPIIEIIIKESNISLPPLPSPPITIAPRKKEQVQVFYVKYKKNPNGYGKDSVVYDKPVLALSPHIPDEPVQVEPPIIKYEAPVTQLPPPSTTLRAIVKPDSESYHADKGIHITFGKQENEHYKRSNDDAKEESAPEPAVSRPQEQPVPAQPQGRQFNLPPERQFPPQTNFFQKRPPSPPNHNFQNGPNFKFENNRFPPQYRPFNQPPPPFKQQPQFGRQFPQPQLQSHQPLTTTRSPFNFQSQPFPTRGAPPPFQHQQQQHQQQQLPGVQHVQFNQGFGNRQPVPYQPFDQIRSQHNQSPQQSQIQFPRTHTHFPIHQQLPQVQQQQSFNNHFSNEQHHVQATQQQYQNNLRHEELVRQQQFRNPQQQIQQQPIAQQPFIQPQNHHQQHFGQPQQQQQQQQQQFQQFPQQNLVPERIIPPGGELIQSLPKYEQHISIPAGPGQQPQALALQQAQQQISQQLQSSSRNQQQGNIALSPQEYTSQIQEQFKQPIINQPAQSQFQNQQQQNQQQQNRQPIVSQQQQQQQPQNVFPQQQTQNVVSQQQQSQHVLNLQNQNILSQQQYTSPTYQTTSKPIVQVSTISYQSPTSTTEASKPSSEAPIKLTEKDLKALNIELPDEVPDELREQLLSSGILKNAQISILDYDKVGDIPISALPPDQLANFYGAGGGQQIAAGSENSPVVVNKDGSPTEEEISAVDDMEMEGSESEVSEVKAEAPVEMKVVHYDPKTEEGQKVQDSYVKEGATQVDPVALNDQQYNRYLPVKVNGAAFPIPDVAELKGRNIASVVVLAPVESPPSNLRKTRDVEESKRGPRYSAEEALKILIKSPTVENYNDWLEKENKTAPDKQAVVLLVTGENDAPSAEKEIFMYDIATKTVSKLSGELSSAFVDAAETNSKQNPALAGASSNVVETRVRYSEGDSIDRQDFVSLDKDLEDSASEFVEAKISFIDPNQSDALAEASEQLESVVDISGTPVEPQGDLTGALAANYVSISSGYSKTGSNLFSQ